MNYKSKESIVIRWYRFERWLFNHKINFLAKIIYHLIQILFGCTIPYSAQLDYGVNIGANAVVLEDVPDNCTVVGVPGKIIKGGSNGIS